MHTDGILFLKDKVKTIPQTPGVYRMLNEKGDVLYVGKAKNLKKRLTNYTQEERQTRRIRKMVYETVELVVVETESEVEALLLEASLIKSFSPPYNVRLKDDKSYPFIYLSAHDFSQIRLYRGNRKEKGRFFGPYPSAQAVYKSIEVLEQVFKLRTCTDSYFNNRARPCLKYHIKRCSAPCTGRISQSEYQESISDAVEFLEGKAEKVKERIKVQMMAASDEMRFEDAARQRDRLKALADISQSQRVLTKSLSDADFWAISIKGDMACAQLFMYRNGAHTTNARFFYKGEEMQEGETLQQAMLGHYEQMLPPKEVYMADVIEDREITAEALSIKAQRKVVIITPKRGDKENILSQAQSNAENALDREVLQKQTHKQLMQKFADLLGREQVKRVEVFDISNIQGKNAVASMVVADEEGMANNQYRKFSIKGEHSPDDYRMMREVLMRRYGKLKDMGEDAVWPDVVMVDGGKGHLTTLCDVFYELEIEGITLCAIAKGEFRDKGLERIFQQGVEDELNIAFNSPLIFLLQRIRDESHRTAIGYHRQKRAKSLSKSALDDVPGIGAKRKKTLLLHFGSADAVKQASVEELAKVEGISKKTAEEIFNYFKR